MIRPPGGASAPTEARVTDGRIVALEPLAREICRRYELEFHDERSPDGDVARSWCLHDNQYVLAWAIQQARDGTVDLLEQVRWLASVLHGRGFPLQRLTRDLEIAAEVTAGSATLGALAGPVGDSLAAAAADVRER
jgi:hypothetical protein